MALRDKARYDFRMVGAARPRCITPLLIIKIDLVARQFYRPARKRHGF